MGTKASEMPNLDNATAMAIVDWLGETREELKRLGKLEGYYKQALLARTGGAGAVEGEVFSALIEDSERTTLDTTSIRTEMGPEWCEERSKTSEFLVIRTTRNG